MAIVRNTSLDEIIRNVAKAEADFREAARIRADVHHDAVKYLAESGCWHLLKLDLPRIEREARR